MKIVLDTNVLISSFITTVGVSREVLSITLEQHTLLLSDYILKEFERILKQKMKVPQKKARLATLFLKRRSLFFPTSRAAGLKFSDKKDIPILELVRFSKPHYFVTGDKKLLELKKMGKTLFLSPREALDILQRS